MDTVRTFGGLLPDKRIANVAGHDVDFTRIPSRYSLQIMRATQGSIDYDEIVRIVAEICSRSAPEITPDYLLDNLGIDEINDLVEYMIEPIMAKAKAKQQQAGADPKNP